MSIEQKTILVVEDDADTATLFAEILTRGGYEVLTSHVSMHAMTLIKKLNPDVVVLDLMMPDVSGLEVLRYVRREPGCAATPVVIVTAKDLDWEVQEGLNAGATIYLTKPITMEALQAAIDGVLRDTEKHPL